MKNEKKERKKYLDNIRWITIVLVVIFHIYFYYNNIGQEAMFEGVKKYTGQISFAGIFQYFVYPWFMLLLFVVSGMSARYALKNKTTKQFWHSRVDKLLVPSTLGVLAFGWIGGSIIFIHSASANLKGDVPVFVKVFIALLSGIGALWFCQVLFVATIVLIILRMILSKLKITDDMAYEWFDNKLQSVAKSCLILLILYFIFYGGAHILNLPMITSYRNGIYISAFLAGYYIFSCENMSANLKKMVLPIFILSCISGVFYIYRCYGVLYTDVVLLQRWDVNLYAFFMVLLVLGAGAKFLNFSNTLTQYMSKRSFGIYVFHIPVMLVTNYLLCNVDLPMTVIYFIELVVSFVVSIILYEIISRIPILRYWILGIRGKK